MVLMVGIVDSRQWMDDDNNRNRNRNRNRNYRDDKELSVTRRIANFGVEVVWVTKHLPMTTTPTRLTRVIRMTLLT